MGFVEDAKGVLDEVGERFAGHPALVQRLAELGPEPQPLPASVRLSKPAVARPAPSKRPPAADGVRCSDRNPTGASRRRRPPRTPS